MTESSFQIISRKLCKRYRYHRVGGYDPETGLVWACLERSGPMFHIDVKTAQPAYEHMFNQVTRFKNGYACVKGNSGLWSHHIKPDGWPSYANRFLSVGLFFEGLADALDAKGQFHINTAGLPVYSERFELVGHFSHGLAQAKNKTGCFHIKPDGQPAYKLRGLRNGPFHQFDDQILAWVDIIKIIKDKKVIVRVAINTQGEIISE